MSQFARTHPSEPHPFEHQLHGGSSYTPDERAEALAELREQSRRAGMCIQCHGHSSFCPVCCGEEFQLQGEE